MEVKTMAFTGPRPKNLCGWNHRAYKSLIDALVVKLKKYYDRGVKNFISGGAQGFDQCAFSAVRKMVNRYELTDVKNIVYVPYKGQEERWVKDGCFGQEEYQEMLEHADEVKILSPPPSNDDKTYIKLLYDRNTALIKDADIILALYDKDDWKESKGGTQDTMRKAYNYGKELHQAKFIIENDQVKLSEICVI